ncbi:MAG TPA: CPBP family intramembrane glutamic endopeptidase [Bryobacteraceae bacterium]|nr:CPBP family intramembrane glutamic endopeptidase [Bryobacteraceae bacterium]
MAKTPGGFRAALLIGWMALGAAGVLFARWKGIPNWAALPIVAAFLVAYPFYLVVGFPALRERLAGRPLPAYLVVSAVLPYLVTCLGGVQFHWAGLVRMAALALAFGLWYVVLPAAAVVDIAFLALIPAVLLGKYLDAVFTTFDPAWQRYAVVLGHVILVQLAVMVLLVERRTGDFGYGFLPRWKDWRIGARNYAYFLVAGSPLALVTKAVKYNAPSSPWIVAGFFLGSLWVLSLSEEFLLRGVLWNWIEEWSSSRTVAAVATSVVFGLLHIGFRGFPNWRWVLIATVLGWFCGRARIQAGSIRASVVTHTLVVTTWQAFFR